MYSSCDIRGYQCLYTFSVDPVNLTVSNFKIDIRPRLTTEMHLRVMSCFSIEGNRDVVHSLTLTVNVFSSYHMLSTH